MRPNEKPDLSLREVYPFSVRHLYSPRNEVELAMIRSILDGENIPYLVHNDHFGSLKIGPVIDLYNAKTIMVEERHRERARELISDFLRSVSPESEQPDPRYSLFDKIRMVIEMLLFGWIVPGKKRNVNELD